MDMFLSLLLIKKLDYSMKVLMPDGLSKIHSHLNTSGKTFTWSITNSPTAIMVNLVWENLFKSQRLAGASNNAVMPRKVQMLPSDTSAIPSALDSVEEALPHAVASRKESMNLTSVIGNRENSEGVVNQSSVSSIASPKRKCPCHLRRDSKSLLDFRKRLAKRTKK